METIIWTIAGVIIGIFIGIILGFKLCIIGLEMNLGEKLENKFGNKK